MERSQEALNLYNNAQAMLEQAAEVQETHAQDAFAFLEEIVRGIVT